MNAGSHKKVVFLKRESVRPSRLLFLMPLTATSDLTGELSGRGSLHVHPGRC